MKIKKPWWVDYAAYFPRQGEIKVSNKYQLRAKLAKRLRLSREARVRLAYINFYETKGKRNASLTCRRFGISRKTFYKWHKRFDDRDLTTLENYSRAPKTRRKWEVTRLQETRIIKLRKKYLRWGKMKLKIKYQQEYGEEISSWRIQKVIEKHQLYYDVPKQQKKRRRKKSQKRRIQTLQIKKRAGFLLHLDTIVQHYEGVRRYIITAIDDLSRIGYARMYPGIGSQNAADFLKRLNYLLERQIENVHHDNGSEFHKHFRRACEELGIPQYWSRVRKPKDNAKLERFNRTLQEEFMELRMMNDPVTDVPGVNRELTEWLIVYNFERPHEALDYEVPWQYARKFCKVLPMYSSSTDSSTPAKIVSHQHQIKNVNGSTAAVGIGPRIIAVIPR